MSIPVVASSRGLLLALLVAIPVAAAPPAPPQVTTGSDTKLLRFDWNPVQGAERYELWFRASAGAAWTRFASLPPERLHVTNSVSVHLLDWDQARYQVRACNIDGCGRSEELGVRQHRFAALGYFKGATSHAGAQFGLAATISEDGRYLAAISAHEPGGEADPAAIHIFTKENGRWHSQARIVPSPSTDTRKNRGLRSPLEARLALSADGSTLAVAMPYRNNTGIGTRSYASIGVYRREGQAWSREYQEIHEDHVGAQGVAHLSRAGDRLVYLLTVGGPLQLLERTPSGWVKRGAIPEIPPLSATESYFCHYRNVALSGDGNTLGRICTSGLGSGSARPQRLLIQRAPDWAVVHDFDFEKAQGHGIGPLAIDHDGDTLALSLPPYEDFGDYEGHAQVFRISAGTLSATLLRPGDWTQSSVFGSLFGDHLTLSSDGAWLAVTDPLDRGAGSGPLSPPLQTSTSASPATYVYDLRAAAPRLRRVLKSNNITTGPRRDQSVAFAEAGKTLLVGDPRDDSGAQGIDGDRSDVSKPDSGALWLY